MNTISDNARQAAEKWFKPSDVKQKFPPVVEPVGLLAEIIQSAIDAATAGVRENADLMARAIKAERAVTDRIVADKDAVIERLREDKARLDWLEQFFRNVGDPFLGFNDDPDVDCDDSDTGLMPVGFRIVFGAACEPAKWCVADTLRAAIDAALHPKEKRK